MILQSFFLCKDFYLNQRAKVEEPQVVVGGEVAEADVEVEEVAEEGVEVVVVSVAEVVEVGEALEVVVDLEEEGEEGPDKQSAETSSNLV